MTTAVLGHLVLDEIHTFDGRRIESVGGIHFALGTMLALARAGDVIRPVFPIGADARAPYDTLYGGAAAIDGRWTPTVSEPSTRVRLHHDNPQHYNTQLVRSLGPIAVHDIEAAVTDADLVYANMMTGEDLLLADALRLRTLSRGLVYLDLHMIAYRVGAHGARASAPVDAWQDWVRVPHVLQCNERELAALGGMCADEDARIARIMEYADLRMLVITRGEAGATLVARDGTRTEVPAAVASSVVDPTGCGDAFGATLAWHLARGVDAVDAARIAAEAAAFVVSLSGSIGIDRLAAHLAEAGA
jgi:sugar/nucleoside kinase (ribokinase family)